MGCKSISLPKKASCVNCFRNVTSFSPKTLQTIGCYGDSSWEGKRSIVFVPGALSPDSSDKLILNSLPVHSPDLVIGMGTGVKNGLRDGVGGSKQFFKIHCQIASCISRFTWTAWGKFTDFLCRVGAAALLHYLAPLVWSTLSSESMMLVGKAPERCVEQKCLSVRA